jgi:hypothetical protein
MPLNGKTGRRESTVDKWFAGWRGRWADRWEYV